MKTILFALLVILSFPVLSFTYVYKGHMEDKEITLYLSTIKAFWVDKDDHKQIQHVLSYDCVLMDSCDEVIQQTSLKLYDDKDIYFDNNDNRPKMKNSISYFKFNHSGQTLFNQTLIGYWFDGKKNQQYPVKLQKQFEISDEADDEFDRLELLQADSSDKFYFTAVLSKKKKEKIKLVGVNVYEKSNHQLIQKIQNLHYSYNQFNSIYLEDINFDGNLDLAIKKYASSARIGENYDYYINNKGKFVATNLWGSDIDFNPKDKSATGKKNCYDYNEKQQRVLTTIQSIYHYQKYKYINIKNSCQFKNIDTQKHRKCNEDEYNACLLNRNNINRENPHMIGEDNILYKNMVWYKGKFIDGIVDDE
ncbi:hypothetical protein [Gilliamella sp. App6-5]|jgi:hypothetical protein|uniref:hypothetical protein n=1 Tax=Gilliamella sp. App6-5 TaxID=3120232 RepID=UPI0011473D2A|nr:hypothetical protein [Gilliamella apicola]